jgi:hypothetical protein
MKKKLAAIAFAGASLAMFAGAPSAGAAHCVEGDSAGYSYFGTDHVQEADHNEGIRHGADPEVEGSGTPGASGCRSTDTSPSDRAPGKQDS